MNNTDWLERLNKILKDHEFATLRAYFKSDEAFASTPDPISPANEESKKAIRETQKISLK